MPKSFELPEPFAERGWQVKIRDRERVEPPHVTVLFKTKAWRYGLREQRFLDKVPDPKDVPAELLTHLGEIRGEMIKAWDSMYPGNRVSSEETT